MVSDEEEQHEEESLYSDGTVSFKSIWTKGPKWTFPIEMLSVLHPASRMNFSHFLLLLKND